MFDENLGRPIVGALAGLLGFDKPRPQVAHLIEYLESTGEKDEVWIPRLAAEGWTVVTADKGSRGGGSKLPRICREHRITHVLLVGRLVHSPQFEKARSVLVIWPELLKEAGYRPRGSCFKIRRGTVQPTLEFVR
mgnify:CR=1 FL=1